ncbi:MAG: divalent-cation tolerance protein CutA [Deinococcales bacterium]|jgi:periplasmic divalent cation tolerance protein
MSTPYRSVYLTFPDPASAERIGRALVDDRLVACINILPGALSLYRWHGEVERDSEVVAFAKTRAELVPAVARRVRELHPYDVPCVVALDIDGGDGAYLRWIGDETQA